jgi:hypothetical protein
VRLVVVVAMLVGFGLSGGSVCPVGAAVPMAMGAGPGAAMAHHAEAHGVATVDEVTPLPDRDGGVIATCLMLLVAIVAAAATAAVQRGFRLLLQPFRSTGVVPWTVELRPPSLAELCLLRT